MAKVKELSESVLEEDDDALDARPSSTTTTPQRLRSGSISDGRTRSNPRIHRSSIDSESAAIGGTPNRLRLEEEEREMTTTIRLRNSGVGLSKVRLNRAAEDEGAARRSHTPRSSKQSRPSVRKIRRWNNDNFIGAASELALAGRSDAADAFLKGQADKGMFLAANFPLQYRSAFSRLTQDSSLQAVKERFVNGEVALSKPSNTPSHPVTAKALFNRMNPRLRKIICSSSNTHHPHLVNSFESYLQSAFAHSITPPPLPSILASILMETPVIKQDSNTTRICFKFSDDTSAAFSRLLLHAVCDFHDLRSVSSAGEQQMKLLTVSGVHFQYADFHMSHLIACQDPSNLASSIPPSLEDSMLLLNVSS